MGRCARFPPQSESSRVTTPYPPNVGWINEQLLWKYYANGIYILKYQLPLLLYSIFIPALNPKGLFKDSADCSQIFWVAQLLLEKKQNKKTTLQIQFIYLEKTRGLICVQGEGARVLGARGALGPGPSSAPLGDQPSLSLAPALCSVQ